jgi:DNA-binding transcriptional MerR regulator
VLARSRDDDGVLPRHPSEQCTNPNGRSGGPVPARCDNGSETNGPRARQLVAGDVGELAGVSGTTIGQWARWGYIRSSQREREPRRYSVEDAAEAAVVGELLSRGIPRARVRAAVERLRASTGEWPLSAARLATAGRRLFLHDGGWLELTARGWQAAAPPEDLVEVRLRFARR